ncbi:MAG TPA: acetolactate synthase large subunit [Thermodesulfobacteriota bacterium]|nr:acetolactate synthase large subunit [Thermodesulfobacteriota bacterium]
MNKNAAELFVECLENEGISYIFGIPGEESLALLEAIRKSGIRFVVTRHEQAAAFMAATTGRLTGQAGVVLSTLGPGATNLVTGVAFAQLGGMPLVVVTGQKPLRRSKHGQFQIINVVQMMQPITKSTRQVLGPELIPSFVREAFRKAEEERPGAVHLEFPEDVASEPTGLAPLERTRSRRPSPDHKAVDFAVALIESARSPLVLVAAGANRKRVRRQLQEFILKTKIPFFTTQMGKGVIDERSPCYIGTAAISESDFLHKAIDRSDLIISVGHDVTEKPPAVMGYGRRKVIHVHFYSAPIDDIYFPTHEVIGDIAHSLQAITAQVRPSKEWDFEYFMRISTELHEHILEKADSPAFPVKPQRLVKDLRAVVPEDGILTLDNGMYKLWIARNYPAYEQNTVLLDNALASMGAGFSAAVAAKLVLPDRKVLCVCGDGGFMMNSQELETAVRLGVDLTAVIVNDGGYGMIKWKQDSMKLPSFGLDFKNPDFVKYAESYGARGFRIKSAEELKTTVAQCLDSVGVNIIDCPIDYSENVLVLTEELSERTARL